MSDEHNEPSHHTADEKHVVDDHGHGDSHGHGDDHGHGHDSHAVPADAIPESSGYDSVLSMLALLVGAALVGLIVYWCSLKPAVVAEGEPGAEHGAQHAVEHVTEPSTAPNSAPAESH